MVKEFKDFNKLYAQLIRTDAAEDNSMRMAAALMVRWQHLVNTNWTQAQIKLAVYEAPSSDEWQRFRVSMKGQSTAMKLARLDLRYVAAQNAPQEADWELEKIRIDNYILALRRGGFLDENYRIVK